MDLLEMPISRKVDMRKLTGKQKGKVQENVNRIIRRSGEGVSSKQPKFTGITQHGKYKTDAFRYGMLFFGIFTKYCKVIPLKTNTITDVLYGLKEGIKAMHGKPETIYSDGEGAMSAILMKEYLAAENIRLIQTRSHAAVAENTLEP